MFPFLFHSKAAPPFSKNLGGYAHAQEAVVLIRTPPSLSFEQRMTTRSSLEEIFVIHRLDERDLNQLCSKEHREEFTKRIKNWKAVGDALGFTQEELDMIDSGFPSEEQKKTALLIQWSMRDKKEATYLNLAKLLFTGEQLDLLQVLCSIIAKATSTTPAGQYSLIALLLLHN